MFKKEAIGYLLAPISLLLLAILQIINRQLVMGLSSILLGFVFLILNFSTKKKDIEFTLVEKDEEFLSLISKGEKIKAIKRCRIIENCGLKEAHDYVESIVNPK